MTTHNKWPWAAKFDATGTYLDTATMGLPPRRTWDALSASLLRWQRGESDPVEFDPDIGAARSSYARLVGVDPSWVALGNQVSPLVGLIAASIPDDSQVLVPTNEFTSISFPFAAQQHRGVEVTEVPLASLAETIGPEYTHVAFAAVQSSSGAIADFDAIVDAAQVHNVRTLVDLTQSAGWLRVDASRFDWTVCSAYKWLLSPRGTSFLTVRPELLDEITPQAANWFAGEDPWDSIYGLPLRLASDARRLDTSPAWHPWVGTAASLSLLTEVGTIELENHALSCERAFAVAADIESAASAIIALVADEEVQQILASNYIRAANRAGRLRLSFHLSTTIEDAVRAGELLRGHVGR